jgi:hypothetical protein
MEALRKNSMNFGLYLGVILVLLTTVYYAIDLSLFTGSIGLLNIVIITAFGIIAANKHKNNIGGFITYKESFTSFFITILIGYVMSAVFMILLFNVIDPEAKVFLTEEMIKKTVDMAQQFGAKTADLNKFITEVKKTDSFGTASQLKGSLFGIVGYCIIGLIAALVIKKEKPESF